MKLWLLKYEELIRGEKLPHVPNRGKNLVYWQNQLFFTFLTYCLPFSFIAFIPCEYMAVKDGITTIAVVDAVCLIVIAIVTFSNKTQLKIRKAIIIIFLYFLSIILINTFGYIGPGAFYMFFLTILIALINSVKYAYWSVVLNTLVLFGFALIINLKLFDSPLIKNYNTGAWIAFSSNIIFLSIVTVSLIHRILDSLQITIDKKDRLKERYKNIFDNSPLPMWLFDTDTLAFIDVNNAAVRHYGYAKEEFLLMSIKNIRPKASVAKLEALVKRNAVSGQDHNGNYEHVKKNGERIYVNIESSLLHLGDRKVRLVLANDITEQLVSESELLDINRKIQESEASLKAIFESTVNGFVLLDDKNNIELFNTKAMDYIKFSNIKFEFEVGKNIFEYIDKTRHINFKKLIKQVYTGNVVEFDRKYRINKAPAQWLRYTLTPVYKNNKVQGVCITGRDVTERKTYVKMIEDQNKTFHEISWMQSHLVRAPLARILGLTDMLNSATAETERAEVLGYLTASSEELDDIIKQIIIKSSAIVEKYPNANHVFPN